MKAAQINDYGDSNAIVVTEVPKPSVSDGRVLVKVQASSINPVDVSIRSGMMKQHAPLTFPATLGGDFAGVVAEVGAGVTNVAVGDVVWGQSNAAFGNGGAMAEYTLTVAEQVGKAPGNVSIEEAASLPLVGVSAWQALSVHLKITSGQKLLILGGSGGIGTVAIQIAKHLGAHVVATATGEGLDLVKQLGADEAVDYQTQPLTGLPNDFDAVLNTVRGDSLDQALRLLKSGGKAVSLTGVNEALAAELGVSATAQMTHVTTEALNALRQLVEDGAVTPQIGKTFSLDHIQDAFKAKEEGHVPGKIVITIG